MSEESEIRALYASGVKLLKAMGHPIPIQCKIEVGPWVMTFCTEYQGYGNERRVLQVSRADKQFFAMSQVWDCYPFMKDLFGDAVLVECKKSQTRGPTWSLIYKVERVKHAKPTQTTKNPRQHHYKRIR